MHKNKSIKLIRNFHTLGFQKEASTRPMSMLLGQSNYNRRCTSWNMNLLFVCFDAVDS